MKKKIRILTSEEMTKCFDTCMLKYGTSAGATAAWDTRGRGTKDEVIQEKIQTQNNKLSDLDRLRNNVVIQDIMGKYNKKMKEIETTNTREHLGEWSIINRDEEKVNELRDIARQLLDGKNPVETTNSEIAKALQAEKEFSQNYLKENGIEGITVYRGVDKNSANQILQQIKDKGFAEVKLNSLSSFTTSKKVANDYVKYNERDSRGGLSFKTNINTSETWMNYHSSPYLWSQTHEKEVVVGTNRIIVIKPEDIIEVSKLSKKSITNKEIVLDNNLFDDQWLHTLRVRNNIKVYKIRKYGTSSGALAAWDTRGRGVKEEHPARTAKRIAVHKMLESNKLYNSLKDYNLTEEDKNIEEIVKESITNKSKLKELYENNPKTKDLIDAISSYTQGYYSEVRNMSAADSKEEYVKNALEERLQLINDDKTLTEQLGYTTNECLGGGVVYNIKNEQMRNMNFTESRRGSKMLGEMVDNAPISNEPIYRGIILEEEVSFKDGEEFTLQNISSFTTDNKKAIGFAFNRQGHEGGRIGYAAKPLVIEVEAGVKALDVSKLSPWRQKERITRGKFKVINTTTGYDATSERAYKILKVKQI